MVLSFLPPHEWRLLPPPRFTFLPLFLLLLLLLLLSFSSISYCFTLYTSFSTFFPSFGFTYFSLFLYLFTFSSFSSLTSLPIPRDALLDPLAFSPPNAKQERERQRDRERDRERQSEDRSMSSCVIFPWFLAMFRRRQMIVDWSRRHSIMAANGRHLPSPLLSSRIETDRHRARTCCASHTVHPVGRPIIEACRHISVEGSTLLCGYLALS